MAYGWIDPAYAGGSSRLDSAVAALQRLLPVARANGVPVIYTTSPFSETPAPKSAADFSPNFRKWDRRACAIDERLSLVPGDYVLYKEYARAFAGTPLIGHLVKRRVDLVRRPGAIRRRRRAGGPPSLHPESTCRVTFCSARENARGSK
jgi:nicotinamidase-related amidase